MRTIDRTTWRVAAVWLLAATPAVAQFGMEAAPYARTRPGAEQWGQRGDGRGWSHGRGNGGFGNPYVYGFSGPIVQGSWYQRPYPYHFDYYRQRWGGEPGGNYGSGPQLTPPDCPCATPPPLEVVQ